MIISVVLIAIMAVCIIIGTLIGLFGGAIKGVATAITAVVSAIVSFLISIPIADLFSGAINNTFNKLIEGMQENTTFADLLESSPTLRELITNLPTALLVPVIFVIAFLVIKLILDLIATFVVIPLLKIKNKKTTLYRVIGIASGVACGIIVAMVLVMPVIGYINFANTTVNTLLEVSESSEEPMFDEETTATLKSVHSDYLEPTTESVFAKIVSGMGGEAAFNSMTAVIINDEKVNVQSEIRACGETYLSVKPLLATDVYSYNSVQADAVRDVSDKFATSDLLPAVLSEVLSYASNKWTNGMNFMGIEKPVLGDTINPLFDALLIILTTSDEKNIKGDIDTIAEAFALLAENEVFTALEDAQTSNLLKALGKEGLITDLLTTINLNKRMAPLSAEIYNLGIRAISSLVNIPEKGEIYVDMISDIKESLTEVMTNTELSKDEKIAKLTERVIAVLESKGVKVEAEWNSMISNALYKAFEDKDDITDADVVDYFASLATLYGYEYDPAMLDDIQGTMSSSKAGVVALGVYNSGKNVKVVEIAEKTPEELASQYGDKLSGFLAQNSGETATDYAARIKSALEGLIDVCEFMKSKADDSDTQVEKILSLSSADTFITSLTTTESLLVKKEQMEFDPEQAAIEAQKYEIIITKAAQLIDSIDVMNEMKEKEGATTLEAATKIDFVAAGQILDTLKSTTAFAETTDIFAEAMLDTLVGGETKLAEQMKDNTSEKAFEELFTSAGQTIILVNDATKDDVDDETKSKNITELMMNLTPSTAKIISGMITVKLLVEQGIPEEYATKSVDTVKALFDNMSLIKDETEAKKEADAIKYIFDIAMAAKNEKEGGITSKLFGENGKIKDIQNFTNKMLNSVVVTETVYSITYEDGKVILDPIGIKEKISDEQQKLVADEIEKFFKENYKSTDTALLKNVVSICALLDISVTGTTPTDIAFIIN